MSANHSVAASAPVGHVYRMSWLFRGFSLIFLLIGIVALVFALRQILVTDATLTWEATVGSVVFPMVGLGMTVHSFASKVVFTADSLLRVTPLKRQIIPLSSIRGRREYVVTGADPPGSTRYLWIERNDGNPPVDLGKNLYRFDDAFRTWYQLLPDLDAMDRVKHKDSDFGLV